MSTVKQPIGSRVLLLTLGSTPQVVTETVYALATADQPWIPDRILLATTEHGARLFEEGRTSAEGTSIAPLLGDGGMLARLIEQLDLPLSLDAVDVVVPRCRDGFPIRDIRTEAETMAFAEELLAIVAEVTARPESELHVSLAGGRKTMSFVAGQVMSIFGRTQDHLSHVLIEPKELEWQDGFWWPGDGSPGSDTARIGLFSVPFLRARAWLDPQRVMAAGRGYANAVEVANLAIGRTSVIIDLVGGKLSVCGKDIELGGQQLATLALMAIAAKRGLVLQAVKGWNQNDRKERCLALGEDLETARRLWVFLYYCCHSDKYYNKFMENPFADLNREMARSIAEFSVDDRIAAPLSRMRKELGEELPTALAERIVAPRGLATLLEPDDIILVGPRELAVHPDWPGEMMAGC